MTHTKLYLITQINTILDSVNAPKASRKIELHQSDLSYTVSITVNKKLIVDQLDCNQSIGVIRESIRDTYEKYKQILSQLKKDELLVKSVSYNEHGNQLTPTYQIIYVYQNQTISTEVNTGSSFDTYHNYDVFDIIGIHLKWLIKNAG